MVFRCCVVQADRLIRELQSSNRLLKSELQATTTTFKQALHAAQTMLDTGMSAPPHLILDFDRMGACICMSAVCVVLFVDLSVASMQQRCMRLAGR